MAIQQLGINYNNLAELGYAGVRRAAAFVAMGQKSWTDENITSAVVEAPFSFQLLPNPLPKALADDVRTAFRLWVIGGAITEIVQGLSRFADGFFELAILVPRNKKEVSQEALDKIKRCQNDTNLHSKLLMIADVSEVKSALLDHTDGWARVRNALAHNYGFVRERDFSPHKEVLEVSWRQFEFSIDGKKVDDFIGHRVEKGGMLGFSLGQGKRDFKLGEQLIFSEQEILNICLTAYFHIGSSIKSLEEYAGKFIGASTKPEASPKA